jgi:DNA-binding transcriptional ArsR family regulator
MSAKARKAVPALKSRPFKDAPARCAPIFAALGDETRLRLVARLCTESQVSIARLTAGSNISRQAIAKHLHVLAGAGLVRGLRKGRERLYELDVTELEQARQYVEIVSRQWDETLSRLKLSVEGD